MSIQFEVNSAAGRYPIRIDFERLFAIGYAGRDTQKTLEHIRELEISLGVPPPKRIPTIFQCGNLLLTQEDQITVVGHKTSGEAEYVIVADHGRLFIAVGSDHTDRDLEGINVPKSKQICPKPIGRSLWPYEEIKEHFDRIEIRSWQTDQGREILYQEGTLADILPAERILDELDHRVGKIRSGIIFSGTIPLKSGFIFGSKFRCELYDPVLAQKLEMEYSIEAISEDER